MTIKELYTYCSNELSFTECGDFEAMCIFNDILGFTKEQIILNNQTVTFFHQEKIDEVIDRRKNGEPLQYILGKWDFYDLSFSVGEGVLIPRPETEILVDFALEKLKNVKNPVVYDLCSGSGCIGLTIAKHLKDAKVYLLEKEENALKYLLKNKDDLKLDNVFVINDDLFTVDLSLFPECDLIVSNPPYIMTEEIDSLQKEVLFEPITALDGGIDGYDFYRCLADRWSGKVKKGGYIAMECGENQSKYIVELFNNKYIESNIIFDFNNIDRVVTFRI
ncbi:MAG: peptide chain release factor N(5)-glutamine methyltransferase [Clostridia bacterium]|nr:peptide chain release factor N(5)-glutamine methyltransferase [Clostridia bacterium]